MKKSYFRPVLAFLAFLALSVPAFAAPPAGIRILTDRSDFHLKSLAEQFSQETKIPVEILFVDDGLLARIQAKGEADVVISKNSSEIIQAAALGLTSNLPSGFKANAVPSRYVSDDRQWFNMSYRIRAFFVAKGTKEFPKSYEELADPAYKGQICIRNFAHNYNLELTSHMIAKHGEEYAAKWLAGLKANLARKPAGNDRDQVKAIANGECKVAVGNTYYMGLMLQDIEQRNWAQAADLYVPNQEQGGALAMFSAVAVTKKGASNKDVARLLNYLVNPIVQQYLSSINFEYPVVGTSGSDMVRSFGKFQGLKSEDVKLSPVSQKEIAKHRATALRLVNLL